MRSRNSLILAVAASLMFAAVPTVEAQESPSRIEVPIKQTVIGGSPRYSVPVRVGGGPEVDAMLDTGSFGMRILPRMTRNSSGISDTGQPISFSYASGVRVEGTVGEAEIHVGGAATRGRIALQLVDDVTCVAQKPKCPASRIRRGEYGFGGNGKPGAGFAAIIGARLAVAKAGDSVANPFYAIGAAAWIIDLPRLGDEAPGRLVFNPAEADLQGFTMIALHDACAGLVPTCLTNERSKETFCGGALLDSGASQVSVTTARVNGRFDWPGGTPGKLTFGDEQAGTVEMTFTAGAHPAGHDVHLSHASGASTQIVTGFLPYLAFSVYFDAENHVIGFRKRD